MTTLARAPRRAIAGAMLSCATALIAACTSPAPTPAPTKTVTVSATPAPSSASPSSASTTHVVPATPTPPGPGPCPTRSLKVTLGLTQGTAGSVYQVIDFTNKGTVSCTLYGYPGVALAGGNPITQIGRAASENATPPRVLVTLAPGEVANALLRIGDAGNYPVSTCVPVPATFLQIYPPNQTTPIYLSYSTTACSGHTRILSVNVVQPGSGG